MLELKVGEDLCKLYGFDIHHPPRPNDGWGHITCDGSVANIESMWAARNLLFLPIAMRHAIMTNPAFASAQGLTAKLASGKSKTLVSMTPWECLNVDTDDAIELETRLLDTTFVTKEQMQAGLAECSVESIGVAEFARRFLYPNNIELPLIIVPQTAHYSWVKAATLLGLGMNQVVKAPVDYNGRLDMKHLRNITQQALAKQQPIMQVVAILGSTEESAVDPLDKVVELRQELRDQGLNFYLHCDAAWGGYFATILQENDSGRVAPPQDGSKFPFLSPYTERQIRFLKHCDSITSDPHKSGFVPYAAGSLCYRNGKLRHLVSVLAPVVYHDGTDPNVGVYGVEGSKPGAAACSVYLSHDVIGLHKDGYGDLLNRCLFGNKVFYIALLNLFDDNDDCTVTLFQRTPAEKDTKATPVDIAREKRQLRDMFADVSVESMNNTFEEARKPNAVAAKKRRDLFLAIGGDLSIVNYTFNFKVNGKVNKRLDLMNELNKEVFERLSLQSKHWQFDKVPDKPMIVTASQFDEAGYGNPLLENYAHRCGVELTSPGTIRFLISTTQNPWLTDTDEGSFIPELMRILSKTVSEVRASLVERYQLDKPDPNCHCCEK